MNTEETTANGATSHGNLWLVAFAVFAVYLGSGVYLCMSQSDLLFTGWFDLTPIGWLYMPVMLALDALGLF